MATTMNSTFNSSLYPEGYYTCASSVASKFITLALVVFYILLAPLFGFVLYIGCTKWRKQRSASTSGNISNSDIITLNMAAIENMNIVGLVFMYLYRFHGVQGLSVPGDSIYHISARGQAIFLCLICLEHYLAVVHPVFYLRLKTKTGVTIRNIIIAFIWFLIFIGEVFVFPSPMPQIISGLILNFLSLAIVSFCSVSVLCVLIRPGPEDGGGDRKRVDQSKRAAYNIITAVLGTLVIRFVAVLVFYVGSASNMDFMNICVVIALLLWFKIPSSLVLPMLFLYREQQLPCGKNNR